MGDRQQVGALPPQIASNLPPRGIFISMKGAQNDAS